MNIPYPWNVPYVTGQGKIGFWTILGYLEDLQEEHPELFGGEPKPTGGLVGEFETLPE